MGGPGHPKPIHVPQHPGGGLLRLRTSCTAVGDRISAHGLDVPLAEYWNGAKWADQAIPSPAGVKGGYLEAVSCPSAVTCTAVGAAHASTKEVPLAELWNGTTWAAQPISGPSASPLSSLSAISCASAASCTVVGYYYPTGYTTKLALAERWSGGTWRAQRTASPVINKALSGVSCVSASTCTAVGYYVGTAKAPAGKALVELS
jgi:hypothetical protein